MIEGMGNMGQFALVTWATVAGILAGIVLVAATVKALQTLWHTRPVQAVYNKLFKPMWHENIQHAMQESTDKLSGQIGLLFKQHREIKTDLGDLKGKVGVLQAAVDSMAAPVKKVAEELAPNGGGSTKDAVNTTRDTVAVIASALGVEHVAEKEHEIRVLREQGRFPPEEEDGKDPTTTS